MAYSKPNASEATGTRNRYKDVCPFSGLCVICLDGCTGLCEVGKSAYRGREVLYPQPFGKVTAASQKDYPIDFSHFNIQGTCVGAVGIEPDSDKAIFPKVNVETEIGNNNKIKLKLPVFIPGLGSTNIAKQNWKEIAIGAAISGSMLVVGENVCAMDQESEIKNGRVIKSPDLEFRIKTYRDWRLDSYGNIVVQSNVEDTKLGVLEYAIDKLGVDAVELKWGQGAKDIGGEVKLSTLERALELKKKGYIVIPDPENLENQKAFKEGAFKEFERHSRIGMVEEDSFYERVEELRKLGAKYVFLKTGSYRPVDLARAVKFSSNAKVDLLTVDGSGGGTGMSPWPMMNEWGIPTVYLESLLYKYLTRLSEKGSFIPSIAMAGGFALEDQIFKGLALGGPYIKAIGMARASITAALVGKTIGQDLKAGKLSKDVHKYGDSQEQIFIKASELKNKYGKDFERIPDGAIGIYTYYDRLTGGLQQLMCGARKFSLSFLERNDLIALTREAADLTGIDYVTDSDAEEVEKILS